MAWIFQPLLPATQVVPPNLASVADPWSYNTEHFNSRFGCTITPNGSPVTEWGYVIGLSSVGSSPGNVDPAVAGYDDLLGWTDEAPYAGDVDNPVANLWPGTTYYVRLWAKTAAGWAYTDEFNFTTQLRYEDDLSDRNLPGLEMGTFGYMWGLSLADGLLKGTAPTWSGMYRTDIDPNYEIDQYVAAVIDNISSDDNSVLGVRCHETIDTKYILVFTTSATDWAIYRCVDGQADTLLASGNFSSAPVHGDTLFFYVSGYDTVTLGFFLNGNYIGGAEDSSVSKLVYGYPAWELYGTTSAYSALEYGPLTPQQWFREEVVNSTGQDTIAAWMSCVESGTLLVACVTWKGNSALTFDLYENDQAFEPLTKKYTVDGSVVQQIFYRLSAIAGNKWVWGEWTGGSADYPSLRVLEFNLRYWDHPPDTGNWAFVDESADSGETGTTLTSGNITAVGSNTIMVAAGINDGSQTMSSTGIGLVAGGRPDPTDDSIEYTWHLFNEVCNNDNAYATLSGSASWVCAAAAFKFIVVKTLGANSGSFSINGQDTALKATRKLTVEKGSFSVGGIATVLKATRKLTATSGAYSLSGKTTAFPRTYKIMASAGLYEETGMVVLLKYNRLFSLESGAFYLVGTDVSLKIARKIAALLGTYSLSGIDVGLRSDHKLSCASGAYAVSGMDIVLKRGYVLIVLVGGLSLAGSTIAMKATRILLSQAGDYDLTGANVLLNRGFTLGGESGDLLLSGTDVILGAYRRIGVSAGVFEETGSPVSLKRFNVLTADPGAFYLDGRNAAMNYGYVLIASSGGLSIFGQIAGLKTDRRISADFGAFDYIGSSVGLLVNHRLFFEPGSFLMAGQDVALIQTIVGVYILSASSGTLSLVGSSIGLRKTSLMSALSGSFSEEGEIITLRKEWKTSAEQGSFILAGNNALLIIDRVLSVGGAAYTLSGQIVDLLSLRKLVVESGAFILGGNDTNLIYHPIRDQTLSALAGEFVLSGKHVLLYAVGDRWVTERFEALFRSREYEAKERTREYRALSRNRNYEAAMRERAYEATMRKRDYEAEGK